MFGFPRHSPHTTVKQALQSITEQNLRKVFQLMRPSCEKVSNRFTRQNIIIIFPPSRIHNKHIEIFILMCFSVVHLKLKRIFSISFYILILILVSIWKKWIWFHFGEMIICSQMKSLYVMTVATILSRVRWILRTYTTVYNDHLRQLFWDMTTTNYTCFAGVTWTILSTK